VVALVKREYGIELSLTTVGRYLKSWGMTAQEPVRRAYERNDEAIAQWCSKTYPALARQAKREGAQIYWGDEMGCAATMWPAPASRRSARRPWSARPASALAAT